ncbi:MAG: hypothetical protein ACLGGV_09745 [Bacteroidia bacterium]
MSDYTFHNIQPATKELLQQGNYILLMHPDKTPPHIAMLCNGLFFSHGVSGTKIAEDFSVFWKYITQKQTPVLFVKTSFTINANDLKKSFSKFTFDRDKEETCLSPIKLYFNDYQNINSNQVKLIFNLLDTIKEQTEGIYSIHLKLDNNTYSIRVYTLEEVYQRIQQLSHA